MLALCLMLFATYYALNYAGIIGRGLQVGCPNRDVKIHCKGPQTSQQVHNHAVF